MKAQDRDDRVDHKMVGTKDEELIKGVLSLPTVFSDRFLPYMEATVNHK